MAKTKIFYKCTNCEYISPRWIGQCPNCQEWNSFVEKIENNIENNFLSKKTNIDQSKINLKKLFEIKTETQDRMISGYLEWDRVMGGGILPGSFIILTGDPGIGKSTLLLQIANKISKNKKVIYFSSEESL
ncbi:DNA repair protein RadA, partial [Candidatus Dependentiae bacterium]|nr:DNA repair protein RadA [Candidatus Dependentiae bacterium]